MTNRYATHHTAQSEYQRGSHGRVLANKLGITRVRDIQQAESEALLAVTESLILKLTDRHRFTADDLCTFHRWWLGDIYTWAGQYRQVNMGKGGFQFAAAHLVPRLMAEFERGVLAVQTPCRGMGVERLIQALARTHAELILIHPFREGNGRLARLLNALMAFQAGFPALDYGGIKGRNKQDYVVAVHAAVGRDYTPMEAVFRSVLRRTSRASHP